jgi:hypothetical protein
MPTQVYTGKNISCLIAKETAWGTATTVTSDIGLVQSITSTDDHATTSHFALGSRNAQDITAGMFTSKISVEAIYQHPRLLQYAIGGVTHTGVADPYKHQLDETTPLPSFTLQHGFDATSDVSVTYTGCKVDTLTLSMGLDGVLRYTADIIARNPASGTSPVAASVSTIPTLTPYMCTISTGAAASIGTPQSFDVTIKNNIENYPILGDRLPTDSQENEREYEWKFTMLFASKTLYDTFLGTITGGETALTATPTISNLLFNTTNGTVGAGNHDVYLRFATAYPKDHKIISKIKGAVVAEFSGTAKTYTAGDFYCDDNIAGTTNTFI